MVFSKFESLSVRPPTPPKDLPHPEQDADETLQFLDDPFGDKPAVPKPVVATKALLNTPQQSPSSDISIPSSSASRQKRVNFELQTCTLPHSKAVAHSWTPTRSSPLRPLPQTRVSIPLKSILKPSDATPTPPPSDQGAAAHRFKTFAEMLESIVKQLASPERPSRMDAYHSLQRTMQAYDKIPDDQALKQKMSLLAQFVKRDIQAPSPTGTGLDSQLVAQALKMLMALFRIADAASAMDDDFCSFIVDRTIHVASDASMPKAVVNTHLAALMQQNFRPKIMTTARVERILDMLDTITERVGGYSVQAYRIRIFRKLIQQRPDIMIKHTERWFKHTIKAFMAGQKDINQSALDIALSAAKAIGHDYHVARSCLAVLNRVRNDGQTVASIMTRELERMLVGDNATLVPQIWSAVTVLLRDSLQGHMFSTLKEWLEVFEKCLVSDKESVRVHTNVAFCYLLYAVNLSHTTSEGWTRMFAKIPLHQLQRRVPAKKAERDAVSSGYLTLLYYALRPTASYDQLDRFWREFVASFWTPLVHSPSSPHAFAACRIVSALLNGSRKPWNEQRALDQKAQCMVQRAELPLLDPKWVRKSISLVLQFVETLLDATPWSENERQDDEPVKAMWATVLDSLVEASSKEVMASSEAKDAMAHIVNLLRRVWDGHTAKLAVSQHKEDLWASKFCFLIETVVQKFGAFQLAEKSLTRNGADEFEVAPTPSHRSRYQGPRISPLLYFVDLLVNQSECRLSDAVRLRAITLILEPCLNAQNGRLSRLQLLRECATIADAHSKATVPLHFWQHIAALLQSTLQDHNTNFNAKGTRPMGKEYQLVVELIALGTPHFLETTQGHDVLLTFIDTVRNESGESAVILAIVEKISEYVLIKASDEDKTSGLTYTTILLRTLPKQTSRRSLEQSRQLLWPSSPVAGRHTDFDPYKNLYVAIISVGSAAYRDLSSEYVDPTKDFLAALATSIKNCTTSQLAVYLRKTQDVIRTWVEDPDRKLQGVHKSLKTLRREVTGLWREVNKAIERLPRKDSQILVHLECLITAGFTSKRRSIVNISINAWNVTFGKEESLRYPRLLEQALRRVHKNVYLSLPSLEVHTEREADELSFYESDSSIDSMQRTRKSPFTKETSSKVDRNTRKSTIRSPATSTTGSRKSLKRQTPKVRLRHDNSQIQFEPIFSSPSNPFNQESQILTERQKEMIERQRMTGGLFANLGAPSPQQAAALSSLEIHSDVAAADDLLMQETHTTPLKALASMGSMDVFLGSSPTPHARRNTRQIASDETNVATPLATRAAKVANDGPLGFLPPRLTKIDQENPGKRAANTGLDNHFEEIKPDNLNISYDEHPVVRDQEEETLVGAEAEGPELRYRSESEPYDDSIMSELPSSVVDLQLTAQLDADIQAHLIATTQKACDEVSESISEPGMALNDPKSTYSNNQQDASDIVVGDTQNLPSTTGSGSDMDLSTTSRLGNSFNEADSTMGTPRSRALRRSSRHSTVSSHGLPSSPTEAKAASSKVEGGKLENSNKASVDPTQTTCITEQQSTEPDEEGMLDNIVVASPVARRNNSIGSKKRKLMDDARLLADSQIITPKTNRKRGPVRRSQSMLSQVESSQDLYISDIPAPKRARHGADQDVSTAKNPLLLMEGSHPKRLSHVEITTKRSLELSPSRRGSCSTGEVMSSEPQTSAPETSGVRETSDQGPTLPSVHVATPSRSFTERVILTPRSIINQLRSLKDYLFSAPQLVLGREEEREIDDALFDIRRQVHAAGLRGEEHP